jgi:hypothetical protein
MHPGSKKVFRICSESLRVWSSWRQPGVVNEFNTPIQLRRKETIRDHLPLYLSSTNYLKALLKLIFTDHCVLIVYQKYR